VSTSLIRSRASIRPSFGHERTLSLSALSSRAHVNFASRVLPMHEQGVSDEANPAIKPTPTLRPELFVDHAFLDKHSGDLPGITTRRFAHTPTSPSVCPGNRSDGFALFVRPFVQYRGQYCLSHYIDTASSRAGISLLIQKLGRLESRHCWFGGTGSSC